MKVKPTPFKPVRFVLLAAIALVVVAGCSQQSGGTLPPTPDFVLEPAVTELELPQGGQTSLWVRLKRKEGFSSDVKFHFGGLPVGLEHTWSRDTPNGDGTLVLKAAEDAKPGTYTLVMSGEAVTTSGERLQALNGEGSASLNVTITKPVRGFTLTLEPAILEAPRSTTTPLAVTITRLGGYDSPLILHSPDAPSSVSVAPAIVPGDQSSSTVNVFVSLAAPSGNAAFTVEARDAGGLVRTANVSLNIPRGGSFDPGFGSDGKATTIMDEIAGLALQGDGKLVVAGLSSGLVSIARYMASGTLESSFGAGGKASTNFGTFTVPSSVALAPDGKIVVLGTTGVNTSQTNFALARFTSSGSPDSSFNGTGRLVVDLSEGTLDGAGSVAVQSDGKIVFTGVGRARNSFFNFGICQVFRRNVNSTPDTSFGVDGVAIVDTDFMSCQGLALQQDGKIVVAGNKETLVPPTVVRNMGIARFRPNGSLDGSFAGNGRRVVSLPGAHPIARAVALRPDNTILAAGSSGGNSALARVDAGGKLDDSFSGNGKLVIDLGGDDAVISLALQSDGKIVFGTNIGLVVRLMPNGSFDSSFGTNGRVNPGIGAVTSLLIDQQGRLVVAGGSRVARLFP